MSGRARNEEDPPEGSAPIIDAHCHIASMEHTPRSFVDGAIDNLETAMQAKGLVLPRALLAKSYEQRMQDGDCDELVAEMDAAGIARTVLLAPDFTFALKDCDLTIAETFARHAEVRRRHPGRFEVFAGADPRWGKDGVDLFERHVAEDGFSGLKIYPPCGYSPNDPALYPFYEVCAHHDIPVLMHIGATSPCLSFEYASPLHADAACRAFPQIRFILAHAATAYTDECLMMAAFRPNVYIDISGFQGSQGPVRAVSKVAGAGIAHKVLFGTDWPVFRMQGRQRLFVEKAELGLGDLSAADRALILSRNAARLLPSAERAPVPREA